MIVEGVSVLDTDEAGSKKGSLHRVRQETGKKSGEARIPWRGFVKGARDIMMRGFFFRVHDDGTVSLTGRRAMPTEMYGYNAVALAKLVTTFPGAGWPDKALADVFRWGADEDADGMPPVCVLSSNHKASVQRPEALKAIVQREKEKGFYGEEKDNPPFVPFSVVPMNLVPKSGGKWRKVANST